MSPFGAVVAVGLSLCAWGSVATPAMARDLPSGFPAASAAVASPSSGDFAYLSSFGALRVRSSTNRTLPVPAECAPEAIFGRHVILCTDRQVGSGAPLDLDVDTGAMHPVAVSPLGPGSDELFFPKRLGAAWLAGTITYTSPFGSGKDIEVPVVVSRATGKTIDLTATGVRSLAWGPRRFVDLGARRPARRLCSPVRRVTIPAFPTTFSDYDTLIEVGAWTLQSVSKQPQEASYVLQRCGSRRQVRRRDSKRCSDAAMRHGSAKMFDRR